jgi:hypothetical protein
VAYNFQTENTIKVLMEYESVTQEVDSIDNKTFELHFHIP